MRAVVVEGRQSWKVTETPDPKPEDSEVVIAVKACGVCGTDLHIFDGDFPANFPLIPGHEFAGEVVEVGKSVKSVKVGDFVAVHPNVPCGLCDFCKEGNEHLCENLRAYGVHTHGGFAQFAAVKETNVHKADGLTPTQAAWAEPLSCCLHGLNKVSVKSGERALVLGCGPIGLLFVQLLLIHGASEVIAVDISEHRLEMAKKFGASVVLSPEELDRNSSEVAPQGFPLVVEASGSTKAVELGLKLVRPGGRFLQFGVCPVEAIVNFSPFRIYRREIAIVGSFSLGNEMPQAIALLCSGRVQVEPLTTHRFGLEGFGEALKLMRSGESLKVQIVP
ncbi:MAG: zinc-dependent alcohol dehydrogenase family protein [Armatimonadetes bacterium]|nr:zinc-dependent alcohol dehydrogenase family protein [Armatimonadota bacterium]MCX7967120.1 zinc-dependent alcohol dehydrogenase family protein [Armatimonadota bacterium]MDW8142703.1 zinc-dependent alcohol dehydrogenase family protein [Armatimonadota bacterium]